MPRILAIHEVEDSARWFEAWQPGPGSRRELYQKHGASRIDLFQDPMQPNLVGLLIEVEDLGAFQMFDGSPEAAASRAEAGVKMQTLRVLAEVSG
jgi:hypothetical protein